MSWILRFHPAVKKDLRRLPDKTRIFVINETLFAIKENPYCGEQLHGPLRGFWKFRFGEYRIAYSINDTRKEIIILDIGLRGGFYERLRRRLGT